MANKQTKVALVCTAERSVIGWIEGNPGAVVNKHMLKRGFVPSGVDLSATVFWDNYKNGVMLLCPRCGNALVCGLQGQSTDAAIKDDLRVILGFFRLPGGKLRYVTWDKAPGTPDPAREVDPVKVIEDKE
jgi:hypothetical protein